MDLVTITFTSKGFDVVPLRSRFEAYGLKTSSVEYDKTGVVVSISYDMAVKAVERWVQIAKAFKYYK
jgi:hypothetical protein